jgi:prepilin peptidase CpaA
MTAGTLLSAILLAAAFSDILTRRIPNWMTGLLALAFVPVAVFLDLSLVEFGWHLAAGFIALVAGFGLHALRWVGGGDVKLFAGAALWLGWPDLLPLFVLTSVAGGILAVFFLFFQRLRSSPQFLILQPWIGSGALKKGMPYGVAIAVAGIWISQTSLTLI